VCFIERRIASLESGSCRQVLMSQGRVKDAALGFRFAKSFGAVDSGPIQYF
jgi:hypothetical protein